MEIISISTRVFDTLSQRVEDIEEKAEQLYRRQENLGLKDWLDNQDVCEILDITKRTLQSYREKGLLPYSRIEYKIRYKPEDMQKLLQSSAHQSQKK